MQGDSDTHKKKVSRLYTTSLSAQSRTQLARAFALAKHGRIFDARKELNAVRQTFAMDGTSTDQQRADLILVDAHVRTYEDGLIIDDAAKLKWVLTVCDSHDFIGQGLALNQLCILSMHEGNLDKAQEYGESAIRLYGHGEAEFGSIHLLAHLGQIKLRRGDLYGAVEQYMEMEGRLDEDHDDTASLLAVCRALRSEAAYEMDNLVESETLLDSAFQSIEDVDSWLDVRAAAYRVRIRLAYNRSGLPGAMTELSRCEQIAKQRSMPRLLWMMQIERVRILTLSNEIKAAKNFMLTIGLDPNSYKLQGEDWVFRQSSTAVDLARWMVCASRATDALRFLESAEDFAIRRGQLLSLAKLRVIKASAHWRLNQRIDATSALISAVRLLGQQPFRRFILDEGQDILQIVQAILEGHSVSARISPAQRKRFADLSYLSTLQRNDGRGRSVTNSSANWLARDKAGKYLELLGLGMPNKEIGRIMGVSVNTVKYHLKSIYRDLKVVNRTQAVVEAKRLGNAVTATPTGDRLSSDI